VYVPTYLVRAKQNVVIRGTANVATDRLGTAVPLLLGPAEVARDSRECVLVKAEHYQREVTEKCTIRIGLEVNVLYSYLGGTEFEYRPD
jgi:hypothetical protein